MLWLLSIVIVAAIVMAAHFSQQRLRRTLATEGMEGRLLYSDANRRGAVLRCKRLGLKGKPDYVFEHEGKLIVIEHKKRPLTQQRPFEGHLLQLAASCVLAEETFGLEVKVGRLQYKNKTIDVPFTTDLRQRMVAALEAMRQAEQARQVHRSHRNRNVCAKCGFRSRCGEALA